MRTAATTRPPVSATERRNIFVFPAWIENNPYLNMLYLVARTRGWVLQTATRLGPLYDHLGNAAAGDVIHVHWTAPISQHADNERDARQRFETFAAQIEKAQRRGVRLIWTVHNRLPHDCPYPELEAEVCRFLARAADVVITLNIDTEKVVGDLYPLDPGKTVRIPHPSYQGLYADNATPADARATVGLADGARGVLFFGQMRRYKGLSEFFDAMAEVHALDPSTVMLLAGKTKDSDREWIDREIPADVPVIRDHRFVPDDEVQNWFAAAETVVLPYQNVLNPGSVFLCATFGRSVVIPRQPHLEAEFSGQPWVRFYDQDDPIQNLADAILVALDAADSDALAAHAFAASRPPFEMASAFDRVLSSLA